MSLIYKISKFHNTDDEKSKIVGFSIEDENTKKRFSISKPVPIQEGRTDEEYINDAFLLIKSEVQKWESEECNTTIGKEFDVKTKKLKE